MRMINNMKRKRRANNIYRGVSLGGNPKHCATLPWIPTGCTWRIGRRRAGALARTRRRICEVSKGYDATISWCFGISLMWLCDCSGGKGRIYC